MKLKAFSIKDTKVGIFNAPWFQPSHGEAERSFMKLANNQNSDISSYPQDFDLYHIGSYDDETSQLSNEQVPTLVMKGVDAKRKSEI